jgi:F420H(2)-dependent quinone reductase
MQLFLALHVFVYRLTGGKIMGSLGPNTILLLETVGRKTAKRRTTPLMYLRDGNNYVITASAGGAEANPGWYYNLKSNPQTIIQVQKQKLTVMAAEASPAERSRLWAQLVAKSPQFGDYETKTKRIIPMIILRPM